MRNEYALFRQLHVARGHALETFRLGHYQVAYAGMTAEGVKRLIAAAKEAV